MANVVGEFRFIHNIQVEAAIVNTLVTNSFISVAQWVNSVEYIHRSRLRRLVVGLDVEWRPNFHNGHHRNPVATLQLNIGCNCLVYQIFHSRLIPLRLYQFLSNPSYTFVGVGIGDDAIKLRQDYGLHVARFVDLAPLAAKVRANPRLEKLGLMRLSMAVLGVVVDKPWVVRTSDWGAVTLSPEQIRYACIDAFLSFEIGRALRAWNYPMYYYYGP